MALKDSILPSTLGPVDILRLSFYSKAPSTSVVAVKIAKLVKFLSSHFDSVGFELQIQFFELPVQIMWSANS